MNTILHLDSSAVGSASATRGITAAIVDAIKAPGDRVIYRDLDTQPVQHLTGTVLSGGDPQATQEGDRLMAQFQEADTLVIGAPMYNFSIPSTLKAWVDRIAVAGKTFRYTENGPVGLAGGKRVIVVSARGGIYGENNPSDFQEAYLRQVFSFIGVKDFSIVRAEGIAYGPEQRQDAIDRAIASIHHIPHSRKEVDAVAA
jgi:FMN-dependent NADH-azoreductase